MTQICPTWVDTIIARGPKFAYVEPMLFLGRMRLCLTASLLIAGLAGCSPTGSGEQDEEKEPHYVLGTARVKNMDFEGAVEAFEEALEVDPHSAPAHFELACLYDANVPDPAAAIYHYQQYLKYNPKADNAQIIEQRINTCKQQLASNTLGIPSTPAAQQQLDHLVEQNRALQQQVDQLQGIIKQWNAYYNSVKANQASQVNAQGSLQRQTMANDTQPIPNDPVGPDNTTVNQAGSGTTTSQPGNTGDTTGSTRSATHSTTNYSTTSSRSGQHSHTVQAGETLAGIARKSGVSLNAILEANPTINPKKLRTGQTVVIP